MFAKKALRGLILTGCLWQFSSWAICHHVCILIIWPIFVYWTLPPPSSSAPAVSSYKQPCSDYFSPLCLWAEQNSMFSPTTFHPVFSVKAHLGQGLCAWPPLGLPWPSPQSRISTTASWVFPVSNDHDSACTNKIDQFPPRSWRLKFLLVTFVSFFNKHQRHT